MSCIYAINDRKKNCCNVSRKRIAKSKSKNNLKSKLDKLDVDILVPVSVDLSKLSNVVKMMLLKKMFGMLRLIPNSKFQF